MNYIYIYIIIVVVVVIIIVIIIIIIIIKHIFLLLSMQSLLQVAERRNERGQKEEGRQTRVSESPDLFDRTSLRLQSLPDVITTQVVRHVKLSTGLSFFPGNPFWHPWGQERGHKKPQ